MILNAKSGICRRLWVLWAICKMKEKQRYALVEQDQIKEGAQVATENQIGTYCIVMSGRGLVTEKSIIFAKQ